MTPQRFLISIAALSFMFSASAFADVEVQSIQQCRVTDQSGTLDSWFCRNSQVGKIRCYADIELEHGAKTRVWGGCVGTYSDCWFNGSGRVDACE